MPEPLRHIAGTNDVALARAGQHTDVRAICGHTWMPSPEDRNYPECPACTAEAARLHLTVDGKTR